MNFQESAVSEKMRISSLHDDINDPDHKLQTRLTMYTGLSVYTQICNINLFDSPRVLNSNYGLPLPSYCCWPKFLCFFPGKIKLLCNIRCQNFFVWRQRKVSTSKVFVMSIAFLTWKVFFGRHEPIWRQKCFWRQAFAWRQKKFRRQHFFWGEKCYWR